MDERSLSPAEKAFNEMANKTVPFWRYAAISLRNCRPRKRSADRKNWRQWEEWPASSPMRSTIRLGSITNVFYLLREHPSLDEEARNYARLAEEELARVTHITKQTLGFYRESAQAIPVSIAALLDDILEFQLRQLEKSNIAVDRRYSSDGVVQGFPGELKQVFLNLICNAIESMPEGGRLRVGVRESSERTFTRRSARFHFGYRRRYSTGRCKKAI